MKKRLFSILLALCMALCLVPTTAFAESETEETPVCTCETACTAEAMNADCPICGVEGALPENCAKCAQPADGAAVQPEGKVSTPQPETALTELSGEGETPAASGTVTDVSNAADLTAAIANSAVDTVKLAADIIISSSLTVNRAVTLDLNGHVLKYESANNGSVIVVENGGQLTIEDSNTSKLSHKFKQNGKLWVLDETNGTETVTGGVITGGKGYPYPLSSTLYCGGGVYIAPSGQLTMTGGNIIGCSAEFGGGVCIYPRQDGEQIQFSMSGGSIIGCVASDIGGGVCAYGTFKMSGPAVIRSCAVESADNFVCGGGVYVDGSFEMSGEATIKGCQAISDSANGGGVFVNSSRSFVMSEKAKIENCQAISNSSRGRGEGGGVYLANNTKFTLSGSAVIQNCTATNSANHGEAYGGGVSTDCVKEITLADSARIVGCTAANGSGLYITGSHQPGYGILYANSGSVDGDVVLGDYENYPCTITGSGGTVFNGKVTVAPGSTIESGTFNGEVINNGTITGGTFNDAVNNNGTITGGVFNGTVTGSGTISREREVSNGADFLAALADPNVTTIKLKEENITVNATENVKELTIDRPITLVNGTRAPNLSLWPPLTIAEGGALTLEGGVFFYPCDSVTVNGSLTVGAGCEVIFEVDQSFLTINQGGTVTTQPAGENTISGLLSLGKDAALTVNGALVNNGRLSVSDMANLKLAASIGGDLILNGVTVDKDYTLDMKGCTLTIGHITFLDANLTVKNASRVDATGVTISGGSYYCPVNVGNAEGVITGGSFYGPVTVKKISDGTSAYISGGTFYDKLEGSYITKGCIVVTFMNGSSQYAMQVVNDKASAPDTPVKSGYTFGGWYKDSTLQTPWDFADDTVTADTTLYAKWNAIVYSDPTYAVSAPAAENGTVTVSPKNASAGSTVTITVKPDSGYVLETISVTDKNGNDLKLTNKGNGKYTFTMPGSKVTVSASFMEDNSLLNFFYDVPNDAYYYEAVKWAAENGITGGVGNSLFAPNQPCTRAQIVTFLWRAAGSPEPKNMSNFSDVPADSYYAKAVAWAVENGITTGTGDGEFGPDATCTRAQSVTFLFRASKASANGAPAFSDVAATAYYAEAVKWATNNGITNGIGDNLFGSDNDCTRAQIVTFLYRMHQEN